MTFGLLVEWVMAAGMMTAGPAASTMAASSGAVAKCPPNITLGWEEYKPYQYEENGKVMGSEIETFELVMKTLGCTYKLEKTPWERTLMTVADGTLMFGAGATITEPRKQFAYFSEAYEEEGIYPYVLKTRLKSMKLGTIQDMLRAGYRVVITAGATYGDDFDGLVKDAKLVKEKTLFEAASEKQAVEMLKLGRADVFLASGLGLHFSDEIADAKKPLFKNEAHFLISKKAVPKSFVADVNAAIKSLAADGSLKKIKAKYFKAPKA